MEIRFNPEIQARLDKMAHSTGRDREALISDALVGYFQELDQVRGMIDQRYDGVRQKRVTLVSSEDVRAHFRYKSEAHDR